jgi:NTP pyrophosphatase (non-canonical NTP hydrolase)
LVSELKCPEAVGFWYNVLNKIVELIMNRDENLKLSESPTLQDFQKYIQEMEEIRGFSEEKVVTKCLQMGEEVGELFKAIRKAEGVKIDKNSRFGTVSEELTDVFIFLLSIANRYDIDLEKAFRAKEEENKKRVWNQ